MRDLDASCAQPQRASFLHFHRPHTFRTFPSSHEIAEYLETWSRSAARPVFGAFRPIGHAGSRSSSTPAMQTFCNLYKTPVFFQSSAVNPLLGGVTRHYQRSEPALIGSPALTDLLEQDCRHICEIGHGKRWLITCRQFRIHCRAGEIGQPTPEGLHCDGPVRRKAINQIANTQEG